MLVVNLFAGPGAGKSTTAARVFAGLKSRGICAELVTEFAKDLTWERRYSAMGCQPYLFGEQLWRMERLRGTGVEVIVTDSPILLSSVYWQDASPEWHAVVQQAHERFRSLNFMLRRVKPYDPRGRRGSEESARSVDNRVFATLAKAGVPFHWVDGSDGGAIEVINHAERNIR